MSLVATITIDHTKVAADLTDFPVLVIANGDAGWAELYNVAAEAGGDIRVFKSDGVTELPREIVSFSVSAQTGEIHIKYTGTLSSTVDTDIQIHADGVSSDYAVTDTYGRNAVWTVTRSIFHMNEASGNRTDSKGVSNLTDNNTVGSASGKIGTAASFNDTNSEYFSSTSSNLQITGNFSMSLWINPNTAVSRLALWNTFSSTPSVSGLITALEKSGSNFIFRFANYSSGSGKDSNFNSATFTNNVMAHLGVVYKQSAGEVKVYKNGTLVETQTGFLTSTVSKSTAIFGNDGNIGAGNYYDGLLDELRLYASEQSASWISTEYQNQNSPSTFYSVAAETGSTPQTVIANGRVSAILALLKRYKRTQTANGRASATVATKKSLKRTHTASIRGSAIVQTASVTFVTVTATIRAASTITDKSINAVAANANALVQATMRRLVRKNFTATGRVSATVIARKTRYVALTASIRGASTVTNAKRFYETVTAIVRGATTVSRGEIFRSIILTATIGVTARLGEYFYKRKYQEEEEEDYKRKFIP